MRRKRLVWSKERYLALTRGGSRPEAIPDDDLTADLLHMWNKHGWQAPLAERALAIDDWLYVPEQAKRGAKPKWEQGRVLHAWLQVEVSVRLARIRNPRISVQDVMKEDFRRLKGKPLRVLHDRANGHHLEIESAGRARRLHSEGRKLLKTNPALAARWERRVSRALLSENSVR